MVRRIFISSVQRELSAERKAIVDLVSGNPQLARFFSTFAFEFDVPAADKRTDEVYLAELAVSDLYVGIIGNEYGGVTPDAFSRRGACAAGGDVIQFGPIRERCVFCLRWALNVQHPIKT